MLSEVASCLFWHWGRHNCFDWQTLIIAVIGSCLRGTCHLLHGSLPFLMLLKKMAGWPAGVFGAEGGSWQSFLESFRWIWRYFCLPPLLPPQSSQFWPSSLLAWMDDESRQLSSGLHTCLFPLPTPLFFHVACYSPANTFYWLPFRANWWESAF